LRFNLKNETREKDQYKSQFKRADLICGTLRKTAKTLVDEMNAEIEKKDKALEIYARNEDKAQLVLDGILVERNLQTSPRDINKQSQTMLAFGINYLKKLNQLDLDLKL